MNITFFEVSDWEKESLKNSFPQAQFTEEKLTEENAHLHQDSEILSCFIYSVLDRSVLSKFPNLKFISIRGTGFDNTDKTYCTEKGIKISNVPEYGSRTVAEYTFALILNLTRKIYQSINQSKILNFDHSLIKGVDLYGKKIGIVGLGKIGINVAEIANGFGMEVYTLLRNKNEELEQKLKINYTDLDTLIGQSDIITLHLPLNSETKHIINKENITKFKKGSYLINTARGGLIDTQALLLGLEQEILEGIALDVLEDEREMQEELEVLTNEFNKDTDYETLVLNHVLLNHPKVLITPHNAFNSEEALTRITTTTIQNIEGFIKGESINLA